MTIRRKFLRKVIRWLCLRSLYFSVFFTSQLHLFLGIPNCTRGALQNIVRAPSVKHLDFPECVEQVLPSPVFAFFQVVVMELNSFFDTNYSRTIDLPHIFLMPRLLSLPQLQNLLLAFANLQYKLSNLIYLLASFYYFICFLFRMTISASSQMKKISPKIFKQIQDAIASCYAEVFISE